MNCSNCLNCVGTNADIFGQQYSCTKNKWRDTLFPEKKLICEYFINKKLS